MQKICEHDIIQVTARSGPRGRGTNKMQCPGSHTYIRDVNGMASMEGGWLPVLIPTFCEVREVGCLLMHIYIKMSFVCMCIFIIIYVDKYYFTTL